MRSTWAYYNEFDKQKAAWLRELIKAGHIAPGEVDERSIAAVQPGDLAGFAQHHWFAGIGVWAYALRCAGWADERPIWTASCPCQPFSAAGQQKGFADERHLWPELFRLIAECRPECIVGEQVAKRNGLEWLDAVSDDLEGSGYACGAVVSPACGYGAPQIRERLYWMARRDKTGSQAGWANSSSASGSRGVHDLRSKTPECREPSGLADSHSARLEERRCERGYDGPQRAATERDGQVGWMECAAGYGREQRWAESIGGSAERGRGASFWSKCDWVLTRPQRVGDPPSLRPVERAPQQVVDGPAGGVVRGGGRGFPLAEKQEARTLRLKGYGDAIVAPQAMEFIKAAMGVLSEDM